MKNVIVNKAQVLAVLITTNRKKLKVINYQHQKTDNKKDHKQKSVIILGASMIKHVNGWEISQKL